MPGLINLGISRKQQSLVQGSCTEAAFGRKTQKAEERLSAKIFCLGRRDESKRDCALIRIFSCVTAFPPRGIVYEQDIQLSRLRDKPITQQDALSRSEGPPKYLPRQDPLSLLRHPLCHPAKSDYQSTRIEEVEALAIDSEAITV
ncbi:hypothetical protein V6N13_132093 [Hibiscus sabdariffa]